MAAPLWSDGGAQSRWRGFRVAIFVHQFLEAFRRGSTFLGAPRTALEQKEVGRDGGVTGVATDVKTAVVRVALRSCSTVLKVGPEAGEGRRSSSLTEDTSPDARSVGRGRIR